MKKILSLCIALVAAAVVFVGTSVLGGEGAADPIASSSVAGDWSGSLKAGFQTLKVVFHVGETSCTLDSPDQGAYGIVGVLKSVEAGSAEMTFKPIGGSFKGKLKDGKLVGVWRQGGGEFPLTLVAGKVEMKRPQEPKPPFPYKTEQVSFKNADASLSGTLTLPKNCNGDTPVLLMVTGSGPQNRDEEVFNHRPFAVIADYLARQGIATLRYDDRGVGESKGKTKNISIEDIMMDAESGVDLLRKRFAHVGVLGHSEGGTVAFMLAQRGKADFIVSLAASALKLGDVLDGQLRAQLKRAGKSDSEIVDELPGLKQAFIRGDDGIRRYLGYDPLPAIKATHCPVLALNGEKDTQVLCEKHLSVLRANLTPKEKMTIKSYSGLNHLFQHCKTGVGTEYAQIEETISPDVLSDIVSFVKRVSKEWKE